MRLTSPHPASTVFEPRHGIDPATGRRILQLTHGPEYCYPLYYYGPTVTADGKTILFHRFSNHRVQVWKLDVETGESVQLTHADTPDCLWRSWDEPAPARGAREHFSAFSPGSDELFYFDGNDLRCVHVHTLLDRLVYELPDDRVPCGLPGSSRHGEHFVILHADRAWWERSTAHGQAPKRHEARRVHMDLIDCASGGSRPLVVMDAWLTHANFLDDGRIIFGHPPTECGVMVTDLRGGWYTHLRTQTPDGWVVNHSIPTARGIMYETVSPGDFGVIGVCDPDTHAYRDFRANHPIHHVGHDPEGRIFFGDYYRMDALDQRVIGWFPTLREDQLNTFTPLTQGLSLYGRGQRSHVHGVIMPDRRHILYTGPDDTTRTNHLFLLDIADLADARTQL